MNKTNDTLKHDPSLSKFIRSYKNKYGKNEDIFHIQDCALEMFYEPHVVFKHKDSEEYLILIWAVNESNLVFHKYVNEHILKTYTFSYLTNDLFNNLMFAVFNFIVNYENREINEFYRYNLFNDKIGKK